ncbi:signal peptidase I [Bacillus sp. BGMRC 2118]|nr:signal peptidase I [Bacillus sp. BGMRC 2118]
MKKTTVKKWISNITTAILYAVLLCMIAIVVTTKVSGGEPQVFGWQFKTVLSGSMEPGIKTGSIIAVKTGGDKNRFKQGDVITFMEDKDKLITHRITEVVKSGEQVMYRTKGDNNNSEDTNPVLSSNVVAEYKGFTVPNLGYFISFANSKNGAFLFIIPGILLFCYSLFSIWRVLAQVELVSKKSPVEENVNT